MHTRRNVLSSFASFGMAAHLCKADVSYEQKIKKERAESAARFKGKDSPFALVGGFNVFGPGVSTIGRDATCSHIVRSAHAPDRVGELTVTEGKATLRFAPGVRATQEGKAVNMISLEGRSSETKKVMIGSLEIWIRWSNSVSGQDLRVSIFDRAFVARNDITLPVWFPIDHRYRVVGDWVAFPEPKELRLPDTFGNGRKWKARGYVSFRLESQTWTLTPMELPASEPYLFFVFGDTTNGHETYGGGRFLYTDLPKNTKVTLDFNEAVNPECAYNHFFNCPLASKDNRLRIPVRAGERIYPHPMT